MILTRGSITILDLVDTALYTYYARDEYGDGAATKPSPDSLYIGFYSGPTLSEQPDPNDPDFDKLLEDWAKSEQWSGWQRYVGEKGEPGDTCREISFFALSDTSDHPPLDDTDPTTIEPFEVLVEHLVSQGKDVEAEVLGFSQNSSYYFNVAEGQTLLQAQDAAGGVVNLDLDDTFNLTKPSGVWLSKQPSRDDAEGKWLWTKHIRYYDSGAAEIWYTVTRDGQDANIFEFELSHPNIKRVLVSKSAIEFSPKTIDATVYNNPRPEDAKPVNLTEENLTASFHFICDDGAYAFDILGNEAADFLTVQGENGKIIFDIQNFYDNYAKNFSIEQRSLREILDDTNEACQLRFGLKRQDKEDEPIFRIVEVANGVTSSLATFNIHATGFNAAVENTTLNFDANGLALGAGDLKIQKKSFKLFEGETFSEGTQYYVGDGKGGYLKSYDEAPVAGTEYYEIDGETVFTADDDGNLTITGTIYAHDGEFSGHVEAKTGAIGNLELKDSVLSGGSGHENFYLDGANGELGIDTAYVYNQIFFQESKEDATSLKMLLKRPTGDDPTVLQTVGINIAANGEMTLGNPTPGDTQGFIMISAKDGEVPYIGHRKKDSYGHITPGKWAIDGSGHATFEDITADNLHVLNSTLEIGNVQAVGGIMIFKDAFTVEEVKQDEENQFYLLVTGFATFEEGDIIYVGNSSLTSDLNEYYQIDKVTYVMSDDTGPIPAPQPNIMGGYPKMRIYLKNNAATYFSPNIVFTRIGPNQSDILYALGYDQRQTIGAYGTAQKNYDFAFGNSFGATRINMASNGSIEYTPRIVLGDLDGVAKHLSLPIEGYGLYCDNVWLNGGLIAANGQYTAGIRSNSKKDYEYKDTSGNTITDKILLWAGAEDTLSESLDVFEDKIANAKFLVTQGGYVHASLGEFTNGVISNSEIHGSDIYSSNLYTVNIHGYNKETKEKVGLNIYDLAHGITFKRGEKETFSIGDAGFFAGAIKENPFIDFSEDFTGVSFWSGDSENRNIGTRLLSTGLEHLNENHLKASAINMRENGEIHFHGSADAYAVFSSAKATFYTPVVYENNKGYLQYLVNDSDGGYDLYVFSKSE